MANMNAQFPNGKLKDIPKSEVKEIVTDLKQLYDLGIPESDAETQERIDKYFKICATTSIRPGIESLSLSLHVSRVTLFNWSHGLYCSQAKQEMIESAKSFIMAFLEQSTLNGRLNPASSIFFFKNWANYKDTVSFETPEVNNNTKPVNSIEEISAELALESHMEAESMEF